MRPRHRSSSTFTSGTGEHRYTSALLDTYLGVTNADTQVSLDRIEAALDETFGTTQSDDESSQNHRNTHGLDRDEEDNSGEH